MVSDAIAAASITALGTIMAAVVAAATAGLTRDPNSAWNLSRRYGYLLGAVIVVLAGSAVFFLLYDGTETRLRNALPNIPGFQPRIYTNIGLGFIYPQDWDVEDYAFRFSGGEMELVRKRPSNSNERQWVFIRIENIAEHHWLNPQTELTHIMEANKKRCKESSGPERASLANGLYYADRFTCNLFSSAGEPIFEETYLYPLSRCIRLRIESGTKESGAARGEFDSELVNFLSGIRLDRAKTEDSQKFCIAHM